MREEKVLDLLEKYSFLDIEECNCLDSDYKLIEQMLNEIKAYTKGKNILITNMGFEYGDFEVEGEGLSQVEGTIRAFGAKMTNPEDSYDEEDEEEDLDDEEDEDLAEETENWY